MKLSQDHVAVLQAVQDLQGESEDHRPPTDVVGARLLAIYKERGGPYFWFDQAPWCGTDPMAGELEDRGLLGVHVGIARFHAPEAPTPTVDRFYLSITAEGRQALRDHAGE
jgi:hypothetical protein